MITDDEARREVAKCVGEREEVRKELARLMRLNTKQAHDEYQTKLLKQAVLIGKLGGLYVALGMDQQLIHQMITDNYWSGLTDKQREYGDL